MALKQKQVENLVTDLAAKAAKVSPTGGAGTYTKVTINAEGIVTGGASIAASDLPSSIDAAKIANGSVSNAEFQYLDGVTSAIQTQINTKAAKATPTAGTYPKVTVNGDGIVTAGASLLEADIPALSIAKTTGLQTALDGKVDENTPITGATKCKITYDAKGLVTAGTDLTSDDLPTVPVSKGGTGLTTLTSGSLLVGAGTGNVTLKTVATLKSDMALNNVTNHAQVKKAGESTDGVLPKWSGITGDAIVDGYSVVTSVGATGSDLAIATEKAVRSAIDAVLGANDAMVFKGVLNCSTNPNYPSAVTGDTYKVSVAGKIGGASGLNVEVGDMIICAADNAGGTHATVGANWGIIQANLDGAVTSVHATANTELVQFNSSKTVVTGTGKTLSDFQMKFTPNKAGGGVSAQVNSDTATATTITSLPSSVVTFAYPVVAVNGQMLEYGDVDSALDANVAGVYEIKSGTLWVRVPYVLETTDRIYIQYVSAVSV